MLCITNILLHGVDVPQVYHDNSLLKDVLDYAEDDAFDVVLMKAWNRERFRVPFLLPLRAWSGAVTPLPARRV